MTRYALDPALAEDDPRNVLRTLLNRADVQMVKAPALRSILRTAEEAGLIPFAADPDEALTFYRLVWLALYLNPENLKAIEL